MVNAPSEADAAAADADATGAGVGAVSSWGGAGEAPRSRANLGVGAPELRADGVAEATSFGWAKRTRHPASILGIFLLLLSLSFPEARRAGRVGSDARAGFGENPTGAPSGSSPKDAPGGRGASSGSTPVLWKSSHDA